MKAFVCGDIEGIADLFTFDEATPESVFYQAMSHQMTLEVAAACLGLKKRGFNEIIVKDSHKTGGNINHHLLPEDVRLIRGWSGSPLKMLDGIDDSFDALVLIGFHDAASRNGNPTAHSFNSKEIAQLTLNTKVVSEMDIVSIAAASIGVPTIFISGDDAICQSAKNLIPGIVTYSTKIGVGASVISKHPKTAVIEIEKSLIEELSEDWKNCLPKLSKNYTLQVEFFRHQNAYKGSYYPGAIQVNDTTIKYESKTFFEVLRFLSFVV